MKKMTTKAKAFNTTKANAGHDKKKARKDHRTALRLRTEHVERLIRSGRYRQMPMPDDLSKLKDVPADQTEIADTETIKL
tara:strand:- start:361 stop:600 length:240 start_codon:yes stop_codon:yes gene_type:complete